MQPATKYVIILKVSLIESEVRRILKTKMKKKNFWNKNEDLQSYWPRDTSVNKKEIHQFKSQVAKNIRQGKTQKWISTRKKPKWYKILNLVFTETKEDLEITGNSADVSFLLSKDNDERTSLGRNLPKNPILVVLIMKI